MVHSTWYMPTLEPQLEQALERALAMLARFDRFLVVSHQRPDGDAVGATLAMCHLLRALGKQATPYNQDPVPYNFQFLPGAHDWTTQPPHPDDLDAVVMLDCGERHRLGTRYPETLWAKPLLLIDHHQQWDPSLPLVAIHDAEASATGELVYDLAAASRVPLTLELAQCLYCCIVTDTGSFRYDATTSQVLRIASALIDAGVRPWHMTSHIYESQPASRVALLGEVLRTLTFSPCARLAFLRLDEPMLERAQASPELADGFINHARGIAGVEVATQLSQHGVDAQGQPQWKISFRSRGQVNVSTLAARFGGGGHRNAAACVMSGQPEVICAQLSQALVELLDACPS